MSVSIPPPEMVALSPQVWPNEWNRGSAPSVTAPSFRLNISREISVFFLRLEWVSSAPLGLPVVPLV